jgi:hypothetical protein
MQSVLLFRGQIRGWYFGVGGDLGWFYSVDETGVAKRLWSSMLKDGQTGVCQAPPPEKVLVRTVF